MSKYSDFKNELLNYAYENKIPISGEFEITSNCNFNCEMCYAKTFESNLSKEDWFKIFSMAQKNGMLYALLTGGEIFSHPDFIEIYEYLYDLGVKVTLFTNGSLLNDMILDTIKKRPPELIAITLYGYDEDSYKSFTKSDSFELVDKNIDLLISNNMNLLLRTIPLKSTYEELDNIISYVKSKNLSLGYFLYVSKINSNTNRLNPSELLDFEKRIREAFEYKPSVYKSNCGAFRNGYFINHKGLMQGCPMMPYPSKKVGDDLMGVFLELQKEWMSMLEKSPCFDCELKNNCMTCVAKRYLEGNAFACSKYLKEIAKGVEKK